MALAIEELNDSNCKTYLLISAGEAVLVDPVRERRHSCSTSASMLAWARASVPVQR
jgi:hypothetical protein